MYLCPNGECLEYTESSSIKHHHGPERLSSPALLLALIQLFHFEEQMQLD